MTTIPATSAALSRICDRLSVSIMRGLSAPEEYITYRWMVDGRWPMAERLSGANQAEQVLPSPDFPAAGPCLPRCFVSRHGKDASPHHPATVRGSQSSPQGTSGLQRFSCTPE